MTNPVSRLWWCGRLLRDDANADDPYHFVRLADVTRHEILACTRHLNAIGAVRMIDTLGREAICEICGKVLEAESHIL